MRASWLAPVVLVVATAAFAAPPPARDPQVASGIRQVAEGDFEGGLRTLDAAARKLAGQPGQSSQQALAILHMGIAYLHLEQELTAKGKFHEALALDGSLDLAEAQNPRRAVRLFRLVKEERAWEVERAAAAASASADPQAATSVYDKAKSGVFTVYGARGHGSGFLLDPLGLVVTNAHVVADADEVRVQVDPRTKLRAVPIVVDRDRDLAVLAIAMSRCGSCAVLPLADSAQGPVVREGQRVVAIGSPVHHRRILTVGSVSKVEERAIFSEVNIDGGSSGGPLLDLQGRVVGINTFVDRSRSGGQGFAGAVHVAVMREVVDGAREAAPVMLRANPASDALLPIVPSEPYPIEPLEQIVRQSSFDLRPYQIEEGDFRVAVMTPPVVAWRQTENLRAMAARGARAMVDTIQLWTDWDQHVGDRKAALVVNVYPKVGKKGLKKFTSLPGLNIVLGFVPFVDTIALSRDYEFKADFRGMRLYRDDAEVVPAERYRLPAAATHESDHASGRQFASQGVYVFRPEDLVAGPDGRAPRLTMVIDNALGGKKPTRIDLAPDTVQAIQRDFAPYIARVAASR